MNAKVSVVKCGTYDPAEVQAAAQRAVDLLGGISVFVKPRSRVLVKPNILMAIEPERGVDTHPEVVRAVIKILKGIDCRIYLGDGPSAWADQIQNIDQVYEKSGMARVARDESVELVRFDKRRWRGKFPLTSWVDECDAFVSIPKFKTHGMTVLTGAIKNLYGLVSDTYKAELHKRYFDNKDFAAIVVDIYQQARPQLTVIDGIVAMEGDGPGTSGKLRECGVLLAGQDGVAIDSILSLIMGVSPLDILTTREAAARNEGIADINRIEVVGEKLLDVLGPPFTLPKTSLIRKLPRPIIDIGRKLIRFVPQIDRGDCTLCSACIRACPEKIMKLKDDRIVIDYAKCISCFCCQEACPSSAITVKKSLFSKMLGL
jgi:uncharacterized protein (DUF362 family)/ferredoxin